MAYTARAQTPTSALANRGWIRQEVPLQRPHHRSLNDTRANINRRIVRGRAPTDRGESLLARDVLVGGLRQRRAAGSLPVSAKIFSLSDQGFAVNRPRNRRPVMLPSRWIRSPKASGPPVLRELNTQSAARLRNEPELVLTTLGIRQIEVLERPARGPITKRTRISVNLFKNQMDRGIPKTAPTGSPQCAGAPLPSLLSSGVTGSISGQQNVPTR